MLHEKYTGFCQKYKIFQLIDRLIFVGFSIHSVYIREAEYLSVFEKIQQILLSKFNYPPPPSTEKKTKIFSLLFIIKIKFSNSQFL